MENKRKILLDCDPGIDDALAICLAVAFKEKLEILGITTVAGNQTIEKVTDNALKLVHFLKEDIPVAKGAVRPLLRESEQAPDIHGKTGLGYCELPLPEDKAAEENAVLFLRDKIMGLPDGEKVTLVPTAPLTNIGLLFSVFPEVKERIDKIVLMGGAVSGGNVTPTAEYNIYADPEAAQIVFQAGVPIVMCGLDVTSQCGLTRNQVSKMLQSKSTICRACGQMLDYYFGSPVYRDNSLVSIHDAVTIMYLVHEEIFEGAPMNVTVDCSQGLNRGMTVCDNRIWCRNEESHVEILLEVEREEFQRILIEELFELDARLYCE